jgi:RNA polymerase sigma factor for flagellar operon FliA
MPASKTLSMPEREALILSQLPQVELLARRQHRKWPRIELDDLISAGTIGLILAVDRYDPSRNLKLKTLAERRIRGALPYSKRLQHHQIQCPLQQVQL